MENIFMEISDDEKYFLALKLKPKSPYEKIVKKGKSFLGFGGKHIYTTSVGASKIFNEDQYKSTLTRAVVDKVRNNGSMHDFLCEMSRTGAFQFDKYASAGRHIDKKFHPSVYIFSNGVDTSIVDTIISNEINKPITIDDYSYEYLRPEVWCKYQLQQLYSYDVERDVFVENGVVYTISDVTYNGDSRKYKCTLTTVPRLKQQTVVTTSIHVEPKDENTDTVTTVVETYSTFAKVETNEVLVITPTVIEEEIIDVPKDSVKSSTFAEITFDDVVEIAQNSIVKEFDSYDTTQLHYIVKYLNLANLRMYYWIYNPVTEVYPELKNITDMQTAETIYPLSVLKDDFKYVTGEQAAATEKLLNSIGLSIARLQEDLDKNEHAKEVMDCFLLIGVSPSEEVYYNEETEETVVEDSADRIVSKVLYETVEYVYQNVGLFVNEPYNLTFKQGAYYNTILWTAVPAKEEKKKLMNVGECQHRSGYSKTYDNYYLKAAIIKEPYKWYYWNVVDIELQVIHETVTADGLILNTYVADTHTLTKVRIDYFEQHCQNLGGGDKECTPQWKLTKELLFTYYHQYYTLVPYQDDRGNTDYTYVLDYLPLQVQLDLNGSNCIGTINNYDEKQIVATQITKQIDFETTKTHTLIDFIANYTIDNPNKTVVVDLNGKNPELVFPILSGVMRKLSIPDRTKLLDNAIYLQYFAHSHTYVKWYKTGAFAALLQVIMIIILIIVTIVTWGSATAPTASLTSALWAVLKAVVVAVCITLALKVIAKYTDGFLSYVLQAAAVVAIMYFTGGFSDFGLNEAFVLANSAVEAFNIYTGEQMEALQASANQFKSKFETRQEDLTEVMDMLYNGLSVLDITDLTVNTDNEKTVNGLIFNTDNFYYLATEAFKDLSLCKNNLPETSVYNFCDNSLALRA